MKTFDLNSMGLQEMTAQEMKDTDGGIILLLCCCAALLLLGGCTCTSTVQIGNDNTNYNHATTEVDSTMNGNSVEIPVMER